MEGLGESAIDNEKDVVGQRERPQRPLARLTGASWHSGQELEGHSQAPPAAAQPYLMGSVGGKPVGNFSDRVHDTGAGRGVHKKGKGKADGVKG